MSEARTISIIGLYKSGTSWLLKMLCNHPQVVGIGEFDVIRAIAGNPRDDFELNEKSELIFRFFGRSPWCKVPRDLLEKTVDLPAEEAMSLWNAQRKQKWGRQSNLNKPQSFFDLEFEVAAQFYNNIRKASSKEEVAKHFLSMLSTYSESTDYLVLKAADQVAVFDRLQVLMPNTKKVLIIRDGRDASISAMHYRQLTQQRNEPWISKNAGQEDMQSLLKGWVSRARMVKRLLTSGEEIYVLRYEDLTLNFHKELTGLLAWLGLDSEDTIVNAIQMATDFKKVTGRERGTEGKGIVRKGQLGEWMEVFSKEEKAAAWDVAGDVLSYFGYQKDGGQQEFLHSKQRNLTLNVTPDGTAGNR